mmetsp:Transcript_6066/g.7883  ORF Transcript_6066/g.7883 Transcript_6066/m.7883 type:complete len:892 (-) Transcript_6066:122-2797(-)
MGTAASVENLPTNTKFAEVIVQFNEGAVKGLDNAEIFKNLAISAPASRNSFDLDNGTRKMSTNASIERLHLTGAEEKEIVERKKMVFATRQETFKSKRRGRSLASDTKLTMPSAVTLQSAPDYKLIQKHLRRGQIFNKGADVEDARQNMEKKKHERKRKKKTPMGEDAKAVVMYALRDFFFVGDEYFSKMNVIFDVMELTIIKEKECLIKQGEKGDRMFVIEEGVFDVEIDGLWVAEKKTGERVGDLALIYNAPRNATVRCKSEKGAVWSITRKDFKQIQALSSSAALVQQSMWLHSVEQLKSLDRYSLSKLTQSLKSEVFRPGQIILKQGEITQKCFLIEKGEVEVESDETPQTIAELMCTVLPPPELAPTKHDPVGESSDEMAEAVTFSSTGLQTTVDEMTNALSSAPQTARASIIHRQILRDACKVTENQISFRPGCFLGVPVMLSAAGQDGGWGWQEHHESEDPAKKAADGFQKKTDEGAICPFTIKATTTVRLLYFTCESFEELIGPLDVILGNQEDGFLGDTFRRGDTINLKFIMEPNPLEELKLSLDDLEEIDFLGRGSFGWVTLVKKKEEPMKGTTFALKALNKAGMVEHDQVQHVIDERRMLKECAHPFIIRLYGTFQDHDNIYLVTELVEGGELWSIIYEGASGCSTHGLPVDHAKFYGAVVVEAIGHMHKKGIAYRDLKPENLMIDMKGYPRVIDLGFAKKIPFRTTIDGQEQVQLKSYTMCGTPEYLAPEFIYNTGHDHTCDLWALGVLIYEFAVGHTPFVRPGREPDMTELFTKIAVSKRRGVPYPDDFDQKAGGTECRDLVDKMMHHEPAKRLGNLARRMTDVKAHPHFMGTRWQELVGFKTEAPWIPPDNPPRGRSTEKRDPNIPFHGDQTLFESF